MENRLIKKSIDASVEAKTKELTEVLEHAADDMNSLLITLWHEMSTQHPWDAAMTLQVLAEAAARHAVTARAHQAQLTTLKCMQEVVDSESTEEERR